MSWPPENYATLTMDYPDGSRVVKIREFWSNCIIEIPTRCHCPRGRGAAVLRIVNPTTTGTIIQGIHGETVELWSGSMGDPSPAVLKVICEEPAL